jgi:hypothetical protein
MFTDMSNHELGKLAKAYAECKDCATCPCDMVVCGFRVEGIKAFLLEISKRLMEGDSNE